MCVYVCHIKTKISSFHTSNYNKSLTKRLCVPESIFMETWYGRKNEHRLETHIMFIADTNFDLIYRKERKS